MDWQKARAKIRDSVKTGIELNSPSSTYRYVLSTDVIINSDRYQYDIESGFSIAIGKDSKINIPWSMLKNCFEELDSSQGYNGKYFRQRYPLQAKDHPCHVHIVGQIFVAADIAYLDGSKYRIHIN